MSCREKGWPEGRRGRAGLPLTRALCRLRRPDDAVQVENRQQVRLSLLQGGAQVLEVVLLLGQVYLKQQLPREPPCLLQLLPFA